MTLNIIVFKSLLKFDLLDVHSRTYKHGNQSQWSVNCCGEFKNINMH